MLKIIGDEGYIAFSCSISMSVTKPAPVMCQWVKGCLEQQIFYTSTPPVILMLSKWGIRLYF